MTNKNKLILSVGTLVLSAFGIASFSMERAMAYRGDYTQKGPNYSQERHEQMKKAFAENNYEAWKELMGGRGRATQVINKDNFAKFAEAHRLMEEGKYEEARKIREELGLGNRTRDGNGYRNSGEGKGMGCRFSN